MGGQIAPSNWPPVVNRNWPLTTAPTARWQVRQPGKAGSLLAGVFTRDSERALRVSRAVRAGAVLVNNYNRAFTGMPFGGVGASGYGRELAVETLHEYAYTKSIRLPSGTAEIPRWAPSVEVTGRAQ